MDAVDSDDANAPDARSRDPRTSGARPPSSERGAAEPELEDTLDALEARREAIEGEFFDHLAQIDRLVDRVATLADRARDSIRQEEQRRRQTLEDVGRQVESIRELLGVDEAARPEWPRGGGALRRRWNAWLRRALRDYLEVLDRRADTERATLDRLRAAVDELVVATTRLATETVAPASAGAEGDSVDQAHGVARQAVEAMAALAQSHEMARTLVDAKEAELLQRVTGAPLRRMDLVFDEFARQQEALLAELIGKRQELEALFERGDDRKRKA